MANDRSGSEPPAGPAAVAGEWAIVGALLAAGLIARATYVVFAGQTRFDPWRHLALVRNIREGIGFSLFDGQPYLWYGPTWHWLCSLLPERARAEWLAVALSVGSVALLYLWVRTELGSGADSRRGAASVGLLAALFGPIVAYTCHLGPEALSLFLALSALLICARSRGDLPAGIAGCGFGLAVVLRTNFAFLFPLALPRLATPRRIFAFAVGGTIPVAASWARNREIISSHPFVFTWDGLAVPSDGFGPLSTLVLQMHPDIASGLRRLHERTMPGPEWLQRADGISWDLLLIMLCGAAALALSRRVALIATAGIMLSWFALFDSTRTSNFFRVYLPLMPVFFVAAGHLVAATGRARIFGWTLVAAMLVGGAWSYRSPNMPPIEAATPPPELLTEDAYMVNGGFFQPESLVYRFPDKRFIGMPLGPERFEEFRAQFPEYRSILWHGFSVQAELGHYLMASGRYEIVRSAANAAGRRYTVLRETAASADDDHVGRQPVGSRRAQRDLDRDGLRRQGSAAKR